MTTTTFRNFYLAIPSQDERNSFRAEFLKRTQLSYTTFDSYKSPNSIIKKIPWLYAQGIKDIAKERHPELLHLLEKEV